MLKDFTIANMLDMSQTIAGELFEGKTYPWEVLPEIGDFIRSLGPLLPENEYRKIGTDIWVHKSAKVAPTIMMAGPMIICEGANVRHSAFLRGNVIIGAGAVVGNSCELKNALIFDEAQIPVTSNVKSDKSLVVVHAEDKDVATGFKKFGAILGDGVEVGCNSVLNPGTVVGKESNIYPLSSVRGCVAAHSIYKSQDNIVAKENREEAPAPKKRATRKPKVVK